MPQVHSNFPKKSFFLFFLFLIFLSFVFGFQEDTNMQGGQTVNLPRRRPLSRSSRSHSSQDHIRHRGHRSRRARSQGRRD